MMKILIDMNLPPKWEDVFVAEGWEALHWSKLGEFGATDQVIMKWAKDNGYIVYVPSLPGCISEGDTKEEALSNIKEAIELYMEPVDDDITLAPNTEIMEIAV
jgi:predicted RNase H-like HicB family nuclease